jgi:putative ABC transport system permease protein
LSDEAPDAALSELRVAVAELDPRLPVSDVSTMRERISGSVETERLRSGLLLLFAGSALALTLLGLWGVIAFTAARRRREIGLRLALGARRSTVLGLVARQGMALVLAGLGMGLLASLGARRLVRSLLFDVGAAGASSLLVPCLVLLVGAAVAVIGPSLRALRVEPAVALRDE